MQINNSLHELTTNSGKTFCTGYSWMYWDCYKDKEHFPCHIWNFDVGSMEYSPQDLYVNRKYQNYKEEILHHICINFYENQIKPKMETYANSNKIKQTKSIHRSDEIHPYIIPLRH